MTELLTPEEVAEKMKVTTQTLYKWRKARKMPFIVTPGGYIRYNPDTIERWINNRTVKQKGLPEHV